MSYSDRVCNTDLTPGYVHRGMYMQAVLLLVLCCLCVHGIRRGNINSCI